jgi:hypothetical protein
MKHPDRQAPSWHISLEPQTVPSDVAVHPEVLVTGSQVSQVALPDWPAPGLKKTPPMKQPDLHTPALQTSAKPQPVLSAVGLQAEVLFVGSQVSQIVLPGWPAPEA